MNEVDPFFMKDCLGGFIKKVQECKEEYYFLPLVFKFDETRKDKSLQILVNTKENQLQVIVASNVTPEYLAYIKEALK